MTDTARSSPEFRAFANHVATQLTRRGSHIDVAVGAGFATDEGAEECVIAILAPNSPYAARLDLDITRESRPFRDPQGFRWFAGSVDAADVRRIVGSTIPARAVFVGGDEGNWAIASWDGVLS